MSLKRIVVGLKKSWISIMSHGRNSGHFCIIALLHIGASLVRLRVTVQRKLEPIQVQMRWRCQYMVELCQRCVCMRWQMPAWVATFWSWKRFSAYSASPHACSTQRTTSSVHIVGLLIVKLGTMPDDVAPLVAQKINSSDRTKPHFFSLELRSWFVAKKSWRKHCTIGTDEKHTESNYHRDAVRQLKPSCV